VGSFKSSPCLREGEETKEPSPYSSPSSRGEDILLKSSPSLWEGEDIGGGGKIYRKRQKSNTKIKEKLVLIVNKVVKLYIYLKHLLHR